MTVETVSRSRSIRRILRLLVSATYSAPAAPLEPINDHARSEGVLKVAVLVGPSADPEAPPATTVVTEPAGVIRRIESAPTSDT